MGSSDPVLEVDHLTKRFGGLCAVDGISFQVRRGKVLGLLGPNGAGKTTTIHMLVGITLPNGGSIRYFGQDLHRHREACLQRVNFASSFNTLQGRISVWENLLVFAHLYSVPKPQERIRQLADYFQITHILGQRFLTLSAGQKTRVNLVKSLLNDPEIILMDEPTASLDPDIADRTMQLLESLKAERELSMVYTSHEMDEVARICDEVVFLDHGLVVAYDTPDGLTRKIATAQLRITFSGEREQVLAKLKPTCPDLESPQPNVVAMTLDERLVPTAIRCVDDAGAVITDIEIKKATLEDVFLQIARGDGRVT